MVSSGIESGGYGMSDSEVVSGAGGGLSGDTESDKGPGFRVGNNTNNDSSCVDKSTLVVEDGSMGGRGKDSVGVTGSFFGA